MTWDARIEALGLTLADPLPAGGSYSTVVIDGDLAYTSGIIAVEDAPLRAASVGVVGDDVSLDDARVSARGAMISTLRNLRGALGGSLDRVERFVKLTGFVRAAPTFVQLPPVLDGATELLRDIFGSDRLPARTTVGVISLPGGATVELDTIVRLRS